MTTVGAINAPLQKLPREPTMVTTERLTPSEDAGAPPTIASAGEMEISAAIAAIKTDRFMRACNSGSGRCRQAAYAMLAV